MNGGSLALAMRVPLMMPTRAPAANADRRPSGSGRPRVAETRPITTEAKVMAVPTDRSIPPVMITKVTPTASTPLTAVAVRMSM